MTPLNRAFDAFFRTVGQHIPAGIAGLGLAWAAMMALQALPFLVPGMVE